MIKLDGQLLYELGLEDLPGVAAARVLHVAGEVLELRVGERLVQRLSEAQLDEFEGFFAAKDEAEAVRWLATAVPDYKRVVREEFDRLKERLAVDAPAILAIEVALDSCAEAYEQGFLALVASPRNPPTHDGR